MKKLRKEKEKARVRHHFFHVADILPLCLSSFLSPSLSLYNSYFLFSLSLTLSLYLSLVFPYLSTLSGNSYEHPRPIRLTDPCFYIHVLKIQAEKAAQTSTASASDPPHTKEMELQKSLALRREKMAAAAEARIAAFKAAPAGGSATGGVCYHCGTSLAGLVPFHRYQYSYCSSACLHSHKEAS